MEEIQEQQDKQDENARETCFFSPPLHTQRKIFFMQKLEQLKDSMNIESVFDLGCGSGSLLRYIRECGYRYLIGLDKSADEIEDASRFCSPLMYHYVKPFKQSLVMMLLCEDFCELLLKHGQSGNGGSVETPASSSDKQQETLPTTMENVKVDALVCSEVIEHLHPDQVMKLEQFIFSLVRPRVVMVSTPNKEFNKWFGMKVCLAREL